MYNCDYDYEIAPLLLLLLLLRLLLLILLLSPPPQICFNSTFEPFILSPLI